MPYTSNLAYRIGALLGAACLAGCDEPPPVGAAADAEAPPDALLGETPAPEPSSSGCTTPRFHQLTSLPHGRAVFEPSIDPSGRWIAFSTDYEFDTGEVENFEISLYDSETRAFSVLTHSPVGVGNFRPRVSTFGPQVVFIASYDYAGQNADGTFELFAVRPATGVIRQLTRNTIGQVIDPVISRNGRFVVYASNGDESNPNGQMNCMRMDLETGEIVAITQVTSGTCAEPTPSADGARVAFTARENPSGGNPDGSIEVFVWEAATGELTQITRTPTIQNQWPRMSADGRRISFVSGYDHVGGGYLVAQDVFLAELGPAAPSFTRVTRAPSARFTPPEIFPDGTMLLFESLDDLTGDNAQGYRQLFQYCVGDGTLTQLSHTFPEGPFYGWLAPRAMVNVSSSAGTAGFAYRSESDDLDPDTDNADRNIELYVGRY